MNNFYIYVYFDPTRELEAFYVGKGKGNRSHGHLTRVDMHPFTHRLQQMARNGVIPIIERYEDLTEEAAFALEIALISEIGRKDLGTGSLLNLTGGGEGVSNKSDATIKKMSELKKGKPISSAHKEAISKGRTGKKFKKLSDDHKRKISESRQGKEVPALKGKTPWNKGLKNKNNKEINV